MKKQQVLIPFFVSICLFFLLCPTLSFANVKLTNVFNPNNKTLYLINCYRLGHCEYVTLNEEGVSTAKDIRELLDLKLDDNEVITNIIEDHGRVYLISSNTASFGLKQWSFVWPTSETGKKILTAVNLNDTRWGTEAFLKMLKSIDSVVVQGSKYKKPYIFQKGQYAMLPGGAILSIKDKQNGIWKGLDLFDKGESGIATAININDGFTYFIKGENILKYNNKKEAFVGLPYAVSEFLEHYGAYGRRLSSLFNSQAIVLPAITLTINNPSKLKKIIPISSNWSARHIFTRSSEILQPIKYKHCKELIDSLPNKADLHCYKIKVQLDDSLHGYDAESISTLISGRGLEVTYGLLSNSVAKGIIYDVSMGIGIDRNQMTLYTALNKKIVWFISKLNLIKNPYPQSLDHYYFTRVMPNHLLLKSKNVLEDYTYVRRENHSGSHDLPFLCRNESIISCNTDAERIKSPFDSLPTQGIAPLLKIYIDGNYAYLIYGEEEGEGIKERGSLISNTYLYKCKLDYVGRVTSHCTELFKNNIKLPFFEDLKVNPTAMAFDKNNIYIAASVFVGEVANVGLSPYLLKCGRGQADEMGRCRSIYSELGAFRNLIKNISIQGSYLYFSSFYMNLVERKLFPYILKKCKIGYTVSDCEDLIDKKILPIATYIKNNQLFIANGHPFKTPYEGNFEIFVCKLDKDGDLKSFSDCKSGPSIKFPHIPYAANMIMFNLPKSLGHNEKHLRRNHSQGMGQLSKQRTLTTKFFAYIGVAALDINPSKEPFYSSYVYPKCLDSFSCVGQKPVKYSGQILPIMFAPYKTTNNTLPLVSLGSGNGLQNVFPNERYAVDNDAQVSDGDVFFPHLMYYCSLIHLVKSTKSTTGIPYETTGLSNCETLDMPLSKMGSYKAFPDLINGRGLQFYKEGVIKTIATAVVYDNNIRTDKTIKCEVKDGPDCNKIMTLFLVTDTKLSSVRDKFNQFKVITNPLALDNAFYFNPQGTFFYLDERIDSMQRVIDEETYSVQHKKWHYFGKDQGSSLNGQPNECPMNFPPGTDTESYTAFGCSSFIIKDPKSIQDIKDALGGSLVQLISSSDDINKMPLMLIERFKRGKTYSPTGNYYNIYNYELENEDQELRIYFSEYNYTEAISNPYKDKVSPAEKRISFQYILVGGTLNMTFSTPDKMLKRVP